MLFLQHVFYIQLPETAWQAFCGQLIDEPEIIHFSPYSLNVIYTFSKEADGGRICVKVKEGEQDCIQLSSSEWSRFQSALTATMDVVDEATTS